MSEGNRAWSSHDSRHCWEAWLALWYEKVFTDCLISRGTAPESDTVELVEYSVSLTWDGYRGTFVLGYTQEAHSKWVQTVVSTLMGTPGIGVTRLQPKPTAGAEGGWSVPVPNVPVWERPRDSSIASRQGGSRVVSKGMEGLDSRYTGIREGW